MASEIIQDAREISKNDQACYRCFWSTRRLSAKHIFCCNKYTNLKNTSIAFDSEKYFPFIPTQHVGNISRKVTWKAVSTSFTSSSSAQPTAFINRGYCTALSNMTFHQDTLKQLQVINSDCCYDNNLRSKWMRIYLPQKKLWKKLEQKNTCLIIQKYIEWPCLKSVNDSATCCLFRLYH